MRKALRLENVLAGVPDRDDDRQVAFALLALGVIESLAEGVMSATDAVGFFFHAENCLYVRKTLQKTAATEIMGRGIQLPDLFDALAADPAHREFQRELAAMRSSCIALLTSLGGVAASP